jgi:transcriptional regulator with GAF, ATPase, and Fis domain
MPAPSEPKRKFPDYVAPTKVHYDGARPRTIQMRTCRLVSHSSGIHREHLFEKGVIRIGAMEDNDLVITDETVSRNHCRIVQEEGGYLLCDLGSTNGTFINGVRVREGFLHSGVTIGLGQSEVQFFGRSRRPSTKNRLGDIIGKNVKMRELYAVIEKIAPTGATVIIEGETGTGKEVVAQTIHKLSQRASQSMMVFDCGAVPKNLIESELFGHEKGSFTGAIMTRQGLFEMAHNSTLFFDELGELPMELQPKLLRALEQREIRRVGATRSLKVDVRIIAATNRQLEEEVRAGRFRQDLYYRLSVVRLVLPPLRERADDIPLLVESFLAEHSLQPTARRQPQVYADLPGGDGAAEPPIAGRATCRELVNAIERAVSFATSEEISADDLPETSAPATAQRLSAWPPLTPRTEARRDPRVPRPVKLMSQRSGSDCLPRARAAGSAVQRRQRAVDCGL